MGLSKGDIPQALNVIDDPIDFLSDSFLALGFLHHIYLAKCSEYESIHIVESLNPRGGINFKNADESYLDQWLLHQTQSHIQ